jgi:putative addiction module component (TIGR02574 family)
MSPRLNDILQLSISERILLVETIWDSIANDTSASIPLTKEQKNLLDKELNAYAKNPTEGASWDKVKSRITKKKK